MVGRVMAGKVALSLVDHVTFSQPIDHKGIGVHVIPIPSHGIASAWPRI